MISVDPSTGAQEVFRALSDPTRREILTRLTTKDMSICEVAQHFPVTRRAVKKHLTILEEGGLISVHTKGRERVNTLVPARLKEARDWLHQFSQFWDERLSDLKKHVEIEEIKKQSEKTHA